jgi:hypothetical protein
MILDEDECRHCSDLELLGQLGRLIGIDKVPSSNEVVPYEIRCREAAAPTVGPH